jgi:hypothetical protein
MDNPDDWERSFGGGVLVAALAALLFIAAIVVLVLAFRSGQRTPAHNARTYGAHAHETPPTTCTA